MTIINNHEMHSETFKDLFIGDVYIDPNDHDICIKVDCSSNNNAFSLTMTTLFTQGLGDEVEKVEATLTLK